MKQNTLPKNPPGVMLYFNVCPCLDLLTTDQQGQLFRAILTYGQYGTEPEFDRTLALVWSFVRPHLDADRERYQAKVEKNRYAVYVRECRRAEEEPLPFGLWLEEDRCWADAPSDDID